MLLYKNSIYKLGKESVRLQKSPKLDKMRDYSSRSIGEKKDYREFLCPTLSRRNTQSHT